MAVARRTPAGALVVLLVTMIVALAAAQQVGFGTGPTCYLYGMRCEPPASDPTDQAVKPCCNQDTYECRAVEGHEGKYCVERQDTCHPSNAMCESAPGLPPVDTKPCCEASEHDCIAIPELDGITMKPGKYCVPKCYKLNERCMGDLNREFVLFRPCCDPTHECRAIKGGLWGKFCVPRSGNTEEKTTAQEVANETKP